MPDLEERFAQLARELAPPGLASDPAALRRRGERRTRYQVASAALATAAAVVAVIFGVTAASGSSAHRPLPPTHTVEPAPHRTVHPTLPAVQSEAWLLPQSHIVVINALGNRTADQLVASATFVPGEWETAYLHGTSVSQGPCGCNVLAGVRRFTYLDGQPLEAYAQAHHIKLGSRSFLALNVAAPTGLEVATNATFPGSVELGEPTPDRAAASMPWATFSAFLDTAAGRAAVWHLHLNASGQVDRIVQAIE